VTLLEGFYDDGRIQFKVGSLEPVERLLQIVRLLLEHLVNNSHVIQIQQAGFISKYLQDGSPSFSNVAKSELQN
jgi:hypothetical protein